MKSIKSRIHYETDSGFQAYMTSIYRYMTMGLGLTGGVALALSLLPAAFMPLVSMLSLVGTLASFGIALYIGFSVEKMTLGRSYQLFWAFSVFMGAGLTWIGKVYTAQSLASAFLVTAAVFGATTLYGQLTKKDLTSWGSFCMMGVFGLLIAQFVGMFFHSGGLQFAISVIGTLVFTGLIAYDTQRLKELYYQSPFQGSEREKIALIGAFSLYLNVINLFLSLLRLIGDRK